MEDCAVGTFPVTAGREDQWLGNTTAALDSLRSRVPVTGPVVLVLPAHLVLTKLVKVSPVAAAKLRKVIQFEAAQGIPYDLADVVWDTVIAGDAAGGLTVQLAAAKLDVVQSLCAAAQAAGFEPRLILPAPLATLAAYRLAEHSLEGPALVLNLGERSTTLLFVETGRFAVRILPFGHNGATRPVASQQDGGRTDAAADNAVEALATRLTQEITRTILHFRRHGELTSPARVGLAGGGAQLAGLAEALTGRLRVPVGQLEVFAAIEVANGVAQDGATGQRHALVDLVGAAGTQLRPGQKVLNLLPPQLRRREEHRRRRPWLIAAAVLAIAAPLPPVRHCRQVRDEALRLAAALEHELAPLRVRDTRTRANLQQLAELRKRMAVLQDVHDRQAGWLNLLSDLQDRLVRVEDVWLEKLQVSPSADGAPLRLHLAGCMLDQTNPLSGTGREATGRVKGLLRDLAASPYVEVAEEGQRFDNSQPGILRFDFVLTTRPGPPL